MVTDRGSGDATGLGHRPGLDGVRGLAIAIVLAYHSVTSGGLHTRLMAGGFLGVDLFFVLSGFLITTLLLEEFSRTGGVSLAQFYTRRLFRLGPALLSVIAVAVAAGLVTGVGERVLQWAWLALSYQTNLYIAAGHPLPIYAATWSLALEEQFYLVAPVLLLMALRHRSPRFLLGVTIALIAGVAAWRTLLTLKGAPIARLYFGPDTRADDLLVGVLFAQLWRFTGFRPSARQTFHAGLFLGAMIFVAATDDRWIYVFLFTPVAVACGIVILGVVERGGLLASRPLVWLGGVSYAAYLWHEPIFGIIDPRGNALGVLASLVLTLGIAALSRRLLEIPAIRLGRRLPPARHPRESRSTPSPVPVEPSGP